MHWVAFVIGIFLGANIGLAVASMLFAAKKRDAIDSANKNWIEYAVMDGNHALQANRACEPIAYYGALEP